MKVLLAYSGGLDTSAAICWLKHIQKAERVSAVLVDVGQQENFEELAQRARLLGADQVRVIDAKNALANNGIVPMLRAGAIYEQGYLLGTAIARPFIADALLEVANAQQDEVICHGATGKGNDYLRFEGRIRQHAPHLKIVSPWRQWKLNGRGDARSLVESFGVAIPNKTFDYSIDANLWHTSYEGGSLEDAAIEPPSSLTQRMNKTGQAHITVRFEDGIPVALNGEFLQTHELISGLNSLLADTGYGWIDIIETRTNGLKSRGIYHTPAGTLLYAAREAIVNALFPSPVIQWMESNARTYGKLIYEGQFHHRLKFALDKSYEYLFEGTSAEITFRICGAQLVILKRNITESLFQAHLGGFDSMSTWSSQISESLVDLQQLKWHSRPFESGGTLHD